jgi:hypothetical protein
MSMKLNISLTDQQKAAMAAIPMADATVRRMVALTCAAPPVAPPKHAIVLSVDEKSQI